MVYLGTGIISSSSIQPNFVSGKHGNISESLSVLNDHVKIIVDALKQANTELLREILIKEDELSVMVKRTNKVESDIAASFRLYVQ